MKYDPKNYDLQKKIQEWSEDPFLFESEGIEYLKKKGKKSFEYIEFLFMTYLMTGKVNECDELIIECFRKDKIAFKYLEMFFGLYDQFSDTPDEALWAIKLLNKIEPSVEKHHKLINLLKLAGKYKESMEEYDKFCKLYPDIVKDFEKALAHIYSDVPEYIEKGKELLKNIKTEDHYPSIEGIAIGGAKFYVGENFDGLIYHFGGEDFRPKNFVSKKNIPNSSKADFNGKSIVITPYRGMGDSMILSRFIPKFLEKWPEAKITIATERPMIPLYKNIPGIHGVGDMESCAGRIFDHCLGVNMLSRYLREQLVDDQGRIPYHEWVAYPESYDEKWKDKFPTDKPLIGINWKGSQRLGGAPHDAEDGRNLSRDIDLKDFKYIIEAHPDKNYLCLNPDIWPEEREWLEKQSNIFIPTKIKDFGDTAALIKLCDVVVSVDTSISTLSASMSKDTIVLAKFWPDYRWLYYEKWWDLSKLKVQVFRKPTPDANWFEPVCETIKALNSY